MSDQPKPKPDRNLSEISHLFLSSIRERQTQGGPRPQRKPPQSQPQAPKPGSVDLTAEELASMAQDAETVADEPLRIPPVTALLGSHLNGRQIELARRYARHLAAAGQRIGLIEIDASEFRIVSFDGEADGAPAPAESPCFDARAMTEALNELSCDVDSWLLLVCNPRLPEARSLLREVDQWVLLCTCDHDGVVSSYKTLKGLADLHQPTLSLSLLDSHQPARAENTFRKLAAVCNQFLGWSLLAGSVVDDNPPAAEHIIMSCRPVHDKAQLASGPHWQVAADFLQRAKAMPTAPEPVHVTDVVVPARPVLQDLTGTAPAPAPAPTAPVSQASLPIMREVPAAARPMPVMPPTSDADAEVIELAAGAGMEAILPAILQHNTGQLVECPVVPPAAPQARLAVDRNRRLVLLAVASQGLADLRSIAQAFRWANENRQLLAMAMPQFAIDTQAAAQLRLIVDQADVTADLLQPLLHSDSVLVQSCRRLRWGQRRGLLLEAA